MSPTPWTGPTLPRRSTSAPMAVRCSNLKCARISSPTRWGRRLWLRGSRGWPPWRWSCLDIELGLRHRDPARRLHHGRRALHPSRPTSYAASGPVNASGGQDVDLGLIEGFYGRPWSWRERSDTVASLAPHGYGFYLYAAKADPFLRRRWRESHPDETLQALGGLAAECAERGVRFGLGLSPFEIYRRFDEAGKGDLARKL